MNKYLLRIGFATLLMVSAIAQAEPWGSAGFGRESCGKWLAVGENTDGGYEFFLKMGWLLGFINGANFITKNDFLRTTDAHGVQAWMDQYCSAHPLARADEAAGALVFELASKVRRP